jgi:hypothetical protein
MSRVFISGANCCRTQAGRSAVMAARAQIEAHGHEVVTPLGMHRPLELAKPCSDGEIRSDACTLSSCDLLALMPGWRGDPDVMRLMALAQTMNILVHELQTVQFDGAVQGSPGAAS